MALTRRNFGGAPTRRRRVGARKRQMSKKKMGIVLGSVAVATAAAVALGMKRADIKKYVDKYVDEWQKAQKQKRLDREKAQKQKRLDKSTKSAKNVKLPEPAEGEEF